MSISIKRAIALGRNAFSEAAALGMIDGVTIEHKFGNNTNVGTTLAPVTTTGTHMMPTSSVSLEVISDSANDTANGSGGQIVTVEYLDSTFTKRTGTLTLNGTSASPDTLSDVLRVNRLYVSRSGTYASHSSASHNGTITLREAGGGTTWAQIPVISTNFGAGQSFLGWYTVPAGFAAYVLKFIITTDASKIVDVYFAQRDNSNDTTTPYSGTLRIKNVYNGVQGGPNEVTHSTLEVYDEYSDIGFLSKVSVGTSTVSVEVEMLIVDKTINKIS